MKLLWGLLLVSGLFIIIFLVSYLLISLYVCYVIIRIHPNKEQSINVEYNQLLTHFLLTVKIDRSRKNTIKIFFGHSTPLTPDERTSLNGLKIA